MKKNKPKQYLRGRRVFIYSSFSCLTLGSCCNDSTCLCLQVNFVAAIDVYEDGEAGLLLCYNCESFLPLILLNSGIISSPYCYSSSTGTVY